MVLFEKLFVPDSAFFLHMNVYLVRPFLSSPPSLPHKLTLDSSSDLRLVKMAKRIKLGDLSVSQRFTESLSRTAADC